MSLVLPVNGFPYSTKSAWRIEKVDVVSKSSRGRKGPRARSWTPEEESYLLQSRDQRVPYKQIAMALSKSELACRLHYHQITVSRTRQAQEQEDEWTSNDHLPFRSCSASPVLPHSHIPPQVSGQYLTLPGVNSLLGVSSHKRSVSAPAFDAQDFYKDSIYYYEQGLTRSENGGMRHAPRHLPSPVPTSNSSSSYNSTWGQYPSNPLPTPPSQYRLTTPTVSICSAEATQYFPPSTPQRSSFISSQLPTPDSSPRHYTPNTHQAKSSVHVLLNDVEPS